MMGLSALAGMLGGGGLPAFPCAVCVAADDDDDARQREPRTTSTVVLGTPVCDEHAAQLVAALMAAAERAYLDAHPTAERLP